MELIHFDQLFAFFFKLGIILVIVIGIRKLIISRHVDHYKKAKLLFDKGNYPGAIRQLDKILLKFPETVPALNMRGECYYILNQYDKSEADFLNSMELEPENLQSNFFVAMHSFHKGDNDNSLEYFSRAIQIQPSNPDLYVYRALVYYTTKQYEKALGDFTKSIELNYEDLSKVYAYRGDCYFNLSDYESAYSELERSISVDKSNFLAYRFRGFLNFYLARFKESAEDLEQSIKLNNDLENELMPIVMEAKGKMN